MMRAPRLFAVTLLAAALAASAAACADDAPNEVTISGQEFSFTVSGDFVTGTNAITFKNEGQQVHHLQLIQILEGHSLDELVQALPAVEQGRPLPPWARFVGGVGQLAPGGSGTVVDRLPAGSYALLCFVPDQADGVPHFAKGMRATITVEGDDENRADVPAAEIEVSGIDDGSGTRYSFDAPATANAGAVTIRFTNDGTEPHEANIFRLEGLTFDQLTAFVAAEVAAGEFPPGLPSADDRFAPVGGIQAVLPGVSQTGTFDLKPGTYVLICFVSNPEGVPHFGLGMARELTVE